MTAPPASLTPDAASPGVDGQPDADFSEGGLAATTPEAGVPSHDANALVPHATRVSLLDHGEWTRVDEGNDPFGDMPESVYCLETSTGPETVGGELAYGVDTQDCNYVTVRQTTRDYVAAGETLELELAHFELTAPTDSQAHLAVRLGDLTLLDEWVPIPSPGAVLRNEVTAAEDIPAGAELLFHVHNHGENSYALVGVTTGP